MFVFRFSERQISHQQKADAAVRAASRMTR